MATPNQAAFSLLVDAQHTMGRATAIASALDGLDGRLSTRLREELVLVYAPEQRSQAMDCDQHNNLDRERRFETAVLSVLRSCP